MVECDSGDGMYEYNLENKYNNWNTHIDIQTLQYSKMNIY